MDFFQPDFAHLFREQMRMLSEDGSFRIPGYSLDFKGAGFIMFQPFGHQRWEHLRSLRWVYNAAGFSFVEMYTDFLFRTGWHVPVDIASFPLANRPAHLRAPSSVHVWSHDTEWDKLRLHQRKKSDDVVVFRRIVSNLFHKQTVPWESFQGHSLRFLVRAFLKAPLRTVKSPEPLTAELHGSRDVTEEWRSYRALQRKCKVPLMYSLHK